MRRRKRILVYGFGPYRYFRENITAKIIESLPSRTGLARVIFPVRFHRSQFVEALDRHKPEIVLGLGQSSRRSIEIETRAVNRRRAGGDAPARAIRKSGPRWLPTTIDPKFDSRIKKSHDAGDYVCNFSMYVVLEEIKRSPASIRFGFIHIPHDYPLFAALRVVTGVIEQLGLPFPNSTRPRF